MTKEELFRRWQKSILANNAYDKDFCNKIADARSLIEMFDIVESSGRDLIFVTCSILFMLLTDYDHELDEKLIFWKNENTDL